VDTEGRFLRATSSHEKYFDPNVFDSGSSWLSLVHPDDHVRAREFLRRLATTQQATSARNCGMVPSKGPLRLVECHAVP